jgi:hypothetical protein
MIDYHQREKIYDKDNMHTWELSHLALSYSSKFELI